MQDEIKELRKLLKEKLNNIYLLIALKMGKEIKTEVHVMGYSHTVVSGKEEEGITDTEIEVGFPGFIMEKSEVISEIEKINIYMRKFEWLDFDLNASDGGIIFRGCTSTSWQDYHINIVFEYPFYISSPFEFSSEPTRPFIRLCTEEEEVLNRTYQIELGNYLFKINASYFDEPPIFVAAKKISCNILVPRD